MVYAVVSKTTSHNDCEGSTPSSPTKILTIFTITDKLNMVQPLILNKGCYIYEKKTK